MEHSIHSKSIFLRVQNEIETVPFSQSRHHGIQFQKERHRHSSAKFSHWIPFSTSSPRLTGFVSANWKHSRFATHEFESRNKENDHQTKTGLFATGESLLSQMRIISTIPSSTTSSWSVRRCMSDIEPHNYVFARSLFFIFFILSKR